MPDWIDTKTIASALLGGFIVWLAKWIAELRRRIDFSATEIYFGPQMNVNTFMGRNYPSDELIGFECDVKLFSNKSLQTGLHNIRLEFCRSSYVGKLAEVTVSKDRIYPNNRIRTSAVTDFIAILLPPREFVTFSLMTFFGRDLWRDLRACDFVRLAADTPDNKTKRFDIGPIRFPKMPDAPSIGLDRMVVNLDFDQRGKFFFIHARRRPKDISTWTDKPAAGDERYWDGKKWVDALSDAKRYKTHVECRDEGEEIKIWNNVPAEWIELR